MSNESDLQFKNLISENAALKADNIELRQKLATAEAAILALMHKINEVTDAAARAHGVASEAYRAI